MEIDFEKHPPKIGDKLREFLKTDWTSDNSQALQLEIRQMVDDFKGVRESLKGLHDDNAEYGAINNIGGYDNHWMVYARQSLTQTEKYLPLFEEIL